MITRYFIIFIFISLNVLQAQQFSDETMSYDGEIRKYKIYIPSQYDGTKPIPLMFNFHGGGGDIASQIAIADMRSIADTANFIIVYPQALPDLGDGGSTNWLHKDPTDVDDVFFVDALIDKIASEYEIDQQKIYACGYSLGGEFTYELACRLNDRIAAVGVVARTMGTAAFDNCSPSHPTGILTILGTEDNISPYDGLTWYGIQYYLSADEMHDYWIKHNNASETPIITQLPNQNQSDGSTVERYSWKDGNGCVTIEHLKVIGGDHDWPGSFGNMDIDASVEIWNYVSQYNLNGLISCEATSNSEQITDINEFEIFPNPVSNKLIINLNLTKEKEYKIYSLNGELVLSGIVKSNSNSIEISNLSSNIYFINIGNNISKFIKQ
ncbi:MAG: T9SS type A sorting domain-containing protein [Saprospiraceae bacterium]|nr:T9SS type A sorting domain-containing protein [Saprospiraceae bacterium]